MEGTKVLFTRKDFNETEGVAYLCFFSFINIRIFIFIPKLSQLSLPINNILPKVIQNRIDNVVYCDKLLDSTNDLSIEYIINEIGSR